MQQNEFMPRQIKTSQSITNLGLKQFNLQSAESQISTQALELLSQGSQGHVSARSNNTQSNIQNLPLQNVAHKYLNPTHSCNYPPTIGSESRWVNSTVPSSVRSTQLSPQPTINKNGYTDQLLEERIIQIVSKCMQQIAQPNHNIEDQENLPTNNSIKQSNHSRKRSNERYSEQVSDQISMREQTPKQQAKIQTVNRTGSQYSIDFGPQLKQSQFTQTDAQQNLNVQDLTSQLCIAEQKNDELVEKIQELEMNNYELRKFNIQACEEHFNSSVSQCEACTDYIKEVRRLEINLLRANEREKQQKEIVRQLYDQVSKKNDQKLFLLAQIEQKNDIQTRNRSWEKREKVLTEQLDQLRFQNEQQRLIIRNLAINSKNQYGRNCFRAPQSPE